MTDLSPTEFSTQPVVESAQDAERGPQRAPRPGEQPRGGLAPAPQAPLAPASAALAPAHAATPAAGSADFIAANRIHVKDGSYFIAPGLVIHPRELDPKNEAALRQKISNAYRFDAPSFFDDPARAMIALNLGTLIPVSLSAERESLMQEINRFNAKLDQPVSDAAAHAASYRMPMQSMAAELNTYQDTVPSPAGLEHVRQGLAMYLMIREAFTKKGFREPLVNYLGKHNDNPDQVLGQVESRLGIKVRTLREAAAGGLGEVARTLGLDDATAYDIQAFAAYSSTHRFSQNALEHWHLGRGLNPSGSVEDKIAAGMQARIERDIQEFRKKAAGVYDVPDAIKAEEQRIAEALTLIRPAEREVLYKLGYQICYSPDRTADSIADFPGILGLHRKLANDLRATDGNYTIYFAGQMDVKKSLRTLRHEIAHNLWPTRFTPEQRAEIDTLAEADVARLEALKTLTTTHRSVLKGLVEAYIAGDAREKEAVAATADQQFAALGLKVSEFLPHLNGIEQLSWLVDEAHRRMSVEGELYNVTRYNGAPTRFREVISRYSELLDIEYREKPQMQALLALTVPGMTRMFRDYYLPQIEALNQELSSATLAQAQPKIQAAAAKESPSRLIDGGSIAQHEKLHEAMLALNQLGIETQQNRVSR